MANYRVAELTWENGQPMMNDLSGYTPIWEGNNNGETLECIVHQATWQNNSSEWAETSSGQLEVARKKRTSLESDQTNNMTTCWDNSFDSTPNSSVKKVFTCADSVSHGGSENQDKDTETEGTTRSGFSRKSRAAAVHNQCERRRRERINQKMKALQKLVPNASKTDKASMLDEVIKYLKQLQAQLQLMSHCNSTRMNMNMNMMMQQYQLQLSLLSPVGNSTTPFLPPHFFLPSSITHPHASPSQSVNVEVYNKMAQLYLQQSSQGTTNH